jgi:all-trans-retinol 13,14-reductase
MIGNMPSALANFKNASSHTTADVLTAFIDHNMSSEDILKGTPLPAWLNVNDPLFKFPNTRMRAKGVMVHPLGDYAVQPRDSSIMAHAMTMNYYVDGAAYTSGPTQGISRGSATKILQNGGDCLVNCIVKEITVKSGKATGVKVTKRGEDKVVEISANNVVNASGVYHLYNQLLPQALPIVDQWKNEFKSLPSTGHIYLFVCLKGTPEKLQIPKTNVWYFNGYNTDKVFDQYFASKGLGIPPTVYLGFPCTKGNL